MSSINRISPKAIKLTDRNGDVWENLDSGSWKLFIQDNPGKLHVSLNEISLNTLYGPLTVTEWITSHGITDVDPGVNDNTPASTDA